MLAVHHPLAVIPMTGASDGTFLIGGAGLIVNLLFVR